MLNDRFDFIVLFANDSAVTVGIWQVRCQDRRAVAALGMEFCQGFERFSTDQWYVARQYEHVAGVALERVMGRHNRMAGPQLFLLLDKAGFRQEFAHLFRGMSDNDCNVG